MKKLIIISLFIPLVFSCSNTKEPQRFGGNPQLVVWLEGISNMGKSDSRVTNKEPLDFFPIGWSSDGNFAWLMIQPRGEIGRYFRLVVQNTKEDQIIEDIDLDNLIYEKKIKLLRDFNGNGKIDTEEALLSNENDEKYIKNLWNLLDTEIKEVLDRHGIVKEKRFYNYEDILTHSAKSGELSLGNAEDYTKRFKIKYSTIIEVPNASYSTFGVAPSGFQIKVSNEKGSKTITSVSRFIQHSEDRLYTRSGTGLKYKIDNIRFVGAFKSPFEERIAIITVFTTFDYQMNPNGNNIYVSGCSLMEGFK